MVSDEKLTSAFKRFVKDIGAPMPMDTVSTLETMVGGKISDNGALDALNKQLDAAYAAIAKEVASAMKTASEEYKKHAAANGFTVTEPTEGNNDTPAAE
jgi:hypothetical protein